MIASEDDPELLEWLGNACEKGGGFVAAFARAALQADSENYPMLRLPLLVLYEKYPAYQPSDAVKQEIRERQS